MANTRSKNDAYEQGWDAGLVYDTADITNPYEPETDDWYSWQRGESDGHFESTCLRESERLRLMKSHQN